MKMKQYEKPKFMIFSPVKFYGRGTSNKNYKRK